MTRAHRLLTLVAGTALAASFGLKLAAQTPQAPAPAPAAQGAPAAGQGPAGAPAQGAPGRGGGRGFGGPSPGQVLYEAQCANCHGKDAAGAPLMIRSSKPAARRPISR